MDQVLELIHWEDSVLISSIFFGNQRQILRIEANSYKIDEGKRPMPFKLYRWTAKYTGYHCTKFVPLSVVDCASSAGFGLEWRKLASFLAISSKSSRSSWPESDDAFLSTLRLAWKSKKIYLALENVVSLDLQGCCNILLFVNSAAVWLLPLCRMSLAESVNLLMSKCRSHTLRPWHGNKEHCNHKIQLPYHSEAYCSLSIYSKRCNAWDYLVKALKLWMIPASDSYFSKAISIV